MYVIIDRFLLLGSCFVLLAAGSNGHTAVVAFLVAVTVSALNGLINSRLFLLASILLYILAAVISTSFLFFLPLVFYDLFLSVHRGKKRAPLILSAAGFAVVLLSLPVAPALMIALLIVSAYVLSERAWALLVSEGEMRRLRDDSWEMTMLLQDKNRELLKKQDYGVRMARLDERGRIAREIHDHVGHLLSRSILQIGALLVGEEKDQTRRGLSAVHITLSEAMDRIRMSVHGLYEESLDFKAQIETLVEEFTFCPIRLDYKLETDPGRDMEHCFLAIIKEGLNNVVRHSNASLVNIALVEHPALYQLVLQDNGTKPAPRSQEGLGLISMADRAEALGGRFTIEREGGFRLFISIPKGGALHEGVSN